MDTIFRGGCKQAAWQLDLKTLRLETSVKGPLKGNGFREGDIIVTAVAHHYAIGRITADGSTQKHLASEKDQEVALALACKLAGGAHRVFLYKSAGDGRFEPVDCERIVSPATE